MYFEFINFEFPKVFRSYLHHHSAVAPTAIAVGRTHAVDDNLLWAAGGRHNKAAGTHAEAIHSPTLYLRHKAVFGCWQPLTAPLPAVVLNLVDEFGRMFQADTNGKPLRLNVDACLGKIPINVSGRMACGKDDGSPPLFIDH